MVVDNGLENHVQKQVMTLELKGKWREPMENLTRESNMMLEEPSELQPVALSHEDFFLKETGGACPLL
jgi:hypothetical protein